LETALAEWSHHHHGIETEYLQDITSELIGHTKITLQVLLDSENRVTAKFDYGSDGSFDLVMPNYATLGYIAGTYTGRFSDDYWPCPLYDLSGDCMVNLEDFAILASQWLTTYNVNDLAIMAEQWLTENVIF